MPDRADRARSALRALERARFGTERTLNLRERLPTPADAVARADQWLRRQQAQRGGEVLVITGRGNQSIGGVSVVRAAIVKLLSRLKRLGVVSEVREDTAGSFIVTLAPMRNLLEAPRRQKDSNAELARVATLPGLDADTHALLVRLARCALDHLGVRDPDHFVEDEMRRQFSIITRELPAGQRRDEQLRAAIVRALEEYESL